MSAPVKTSARKSDAKKRKDPAPQGTTTSAPAPATAPPAAPRDPAPAPANTVPRSFVTRLLSFVSSMIAGLWAMVLLAVDRISAFIGDWLFNGKKALYGLAVTRILFGVTAIGLLASNFGTRLYTFGSGSAWNGELAEPVSEFPKIWVFSAFHAAMGQRRPLHGALPSSRGARRAVRPRVALPDRAPDLLLPLGGLHRGQRHGGRPGRQHVPHRAAAAALRRPRSPVVAGCQASGEVGGVVRPEQPAGAAGNDVPQSRPRGTRRPGVLRLRVRCALQGGWCAVGRGVCGLQPAADRAVRHLAGVERPRHRVGADGHDRELGVDPPAGRLPPHAADASTR